MAFNRLDLTLQKYRRAMENGNEQEAEFYKNEIIGGHEPTKDARGASELKRWLGGRKITEKTNFDVPESIATCVDCDSKLTVEVDGWTIEREGINLWVATSLTPWCERWEQCVEEQSFACQTDFIRNQNRILNWLNEQYRWQV